VWERRPRRDAVSRGALRGWGRRAEGASSAQRKSVSEAALRSVAKGNCAIARRGGEVKQSGDPFHPRGTRSGAESVASLLGEGEA
jgi:hypothetical protein